MSGRTGQMRNLDEKLPWYYYLYNTIKETPINLALLFVSAFIFYKMVRITRNRCNQNHVNSPWVRETPVKKLELPLLSRDFTVEELFEYNGTREDGRILVAVYFNVYDVSCAKHFYGIGGTYPQYAGCDISRNLINFSAVVNEHRIFDDFSDLTEKQMGILIEWDQQYAEKYPFVGHLVRYQEEPNNSFDEMDDNARIREITTI